MYRINVRSNVQNKSQEMKNIVGIKNQKRYQNINLKSKYTAFIFTSIFVRIVKTI